MAHLKYGRTEKSCVAEHAFDNNHRISLENLKLLNNVTDRRSLNAYESVNIIKCKNILNKDRKSFHTVRSTGYSVKLSSSPPLFYRSADALFHLGINIRVRVVNLVLIIS